MLADENNHHGKETVMKIIGAHSRVSPFLIAVVLLLQLSPALATGRPETDLVWSADEARKRGATAVFCNR